MRQRVIRVVAPLAPLWEIVPDGRDRARAGWDSRPPRLARGAPPRYAFTTLFWVMLHVAFRAPVWYAVLHPLAACVLMAIFARAAWRGDRVEWRGRSYVSS